MNEFAFFVAGVVLFDCVGVLWSAGFGVVGVEGIDGLGELANGFDMVGGGLDIS